MNIVLYEPDIPHNTGNIIRLCACTGSNLYLVGKLGFHITDKHMKRAGLDYSKAVKIERVATLHELEEKVNVKSENNFYYFSTKAKKLYTDVCYKPDDFLVFGSETKGLPEDLIFSNPEKSLTLPMKKGKRSLNLANSASIVLYEALRQNGFNDLHPISCPYS